MYRYGLDADDPPCPRPTNRDMCGAADAHGRCVKTTDVAGQPLFDAVMVGAVKVAVQVAAHVACNLPIALASASSFNP